MVKLKMKIQTSRLLLTKLKEQDRKHCEDMLQLELSLQHKQDELLKKDVELQKKDDELRKKRF